jgi:uncharacterized protein YbjT (DUF2867 family)
MNQTAPLRRVLVFGASGHIGGPLAEYVFRTSPDTAVRAATSDESKVAALRESLPRAEVVTADYNDPASLESALHEVDGVFLITPDFLDETVAMRNFIAATKATGTVRHIVRITGDPPEVHDLTDVPQILREWQGGTAIQHQVARELLVESGLPVSFVNIAAYIMDDYATMFAPPLLMHRMITLPFDHQMAYIDAADIGEVAGEILLRTDGSFIGSTTHLDNGIDLLTFAEVAALIGEVLGEPIGFDDTPEKFTEVNGEILRAWVGRADAADYYVEYFRWEADIAHTFRTTDVVRRLLGRDAKSLRQWFEENRQALEAPTTSNA